MTQLEIDYVGWDFIPTPKQMKELRVVATAKVVAQDIARAMKKSPHENEFPFNICPLVINDPSALSKKVEQIITKAFDNWGWIFKVDKETKSFVISEKV